MVLRGRNKERCGLSYALVETLPNGIVIVIALGKELGIAVFGYSPLGNGFLTGNIKKENVDPSEHRFHNPRWQEEVVAIIYQSCLPDR